MTPREPRTAPRRRWIRRLLVAAFTFLTALLAAEGISRSMERSAPAAVEFDHFRQTATSQFYEVDPDFGFRPIFGGGQYDERGFVRNEYAPAKEPSRERILWIGDSVTRRGRILHAVRELYGDERYEWWNAGVESFNLVQTVHYFLRFSHVCEPDHVVLTFHYNDFHTTPVVYPDDQGGLAVYAPTRPRANVNGWLFEHSNLYRRLLKAVDGDDGQLAIETEMRAALAELAAWTAAHGTRLSVLVFPPLLPREEWYQVEGQWFDRAVAMSEDLGLPTYSLFEPLCDALADGLEVMEQAGDKSHPNDAVSAVFARYLQAHGLL